MGDLQEFLANSAGEIIGVLLEFAFSMILAGILVFSIHHFNIFTMTVFFMVLGLWIRWFTLISLKIRESNNDKYKRENQSISNC